jgi:hypothetical protein
VLWLSQLTLYFLKKAVQNINYVILSMLLPPFIVMRLRGNSHIYVILVSLLLLSKIIILRDDSSLFVLLASAFIVYALLLVVATTMVQYYYYHHHKNQRSSFLLIVTLCCVALLLNHHAASAAPQYNAWESVSPPISDSTIREFHVGAVVNGALVVFGGADIQHLLNDTILLESRKDSSFVLVFYLLLTRQPYP